MLLESDALDPWTGLSRYDLDSMCKLPEVYAANRINDDEVCGTNMLTRWRRDKMADIFKCIYITSVNENYISIQISLEIVRKGPINNKPS